MKSQRVVVIYAEAVYTFMSRIDARRPDDVRGPVGSED